MTEILNENSVIEFFFRSSINIYAELCVYNIKKVQFIQKQYFLSVLRNQLLEQMISRCSTFDWHFLAIVHKLHEFELRHKGTSLSALAGSK